MILIPFYLVYWLIGSVLMIIWLVFRLALFLITLPFPGYRRHRRVVRAQRRRLRL